MKIKSILFIVFIGLTSLSLPAQEKLTILTRQEKAQAIETICVRLNRFYVFPDIAKQMEAHIKSKLAAGAFEKTDDAAAFADAVTQELRAVSHDKHLGLFFGPNPDLQPRQDLALRRILNRIDLEESNYGLDRVEILPGNVGYLSIRSVMFYEPVKDILSAAMKLLSNTNAIIFDLRDNRGGDPQYMAYLFGFFFDKPIHINSVYWRDRDRMVEFWTTAEVPGRKMIDVPLFVLINRRTFSGAEEFAYDLQALKRATIIGEVSEGGAHPSSSFVVYKDLRILIPLGRAINPVTGTNWEGIGVKPDIEVSSDAALTMAAEKANAAGEKYREAKKSRILAKYQECSASLAEAEKLFQANNAKAGADLVASALKQALEADLHTQASVNRMGYDFLEKKSYPMAIAILDFNASAFPKSANAYDSLGEAYLRSGDKARAREWYMKALALDPNLASAKKALQEIDR